MTGDSTDDETYRACHDWQRDDELSTSVASALSEVTNGEPFAGRPLDEVIDADALDRLFSPSGESLRLGGHVEFEFEECDVTVHGSGKIVIVRPGGEGAAHAE